MAAANVVAKFTADISDVQAKMTALKQSFQQAGDSTEALSQRMVMLGNTVSDVGKKMTLGITAPLAALGVVAINTQKDFEVSMNTLGVVSGAAAGEVQQLSAYAMKMGADTVYSAGEAANAMVDLAKSGFTPAQITGGGLAATMALAATEGMALSDAAVTVANAMATFGLQADQASIIADALAGGANASTASVESLTSALRQVGPGAVNAGLSLQETVATLAAFDAAGIKGSDAGTSLKTMLMRLVPSTNEAATAMQELGLNFTNADGSFKSITEIAAILQRQLGGLTEAQKVQALTTVFGADATRAATVLMNEGAAGIQTYIDGTNQLGAAQELANARMSGTAGTLEQLKGSLETAALVIGENLAPTFQVTANLIKTATDAFLGLPKPLQQLAVGAGAVVAAMGPLLWIVGKIMTVFGPLGAAALALRTRMVTAFRVIGASAKATEIQVKTAMIGAQTSMGALAAGARAAGAGVVATFRTMTGAIRGFMAALGPVGIAIMGASFAYEAFMGAQQEAEDKVVRLTDAMKEQNAVMGEALAMQLAQDMQELAYGFAETTNFVDDLSALGITLDEVVLALMKGGPAVQDLTGRIQEAAAGNDQLRMAAANVIGTLAMENAAVDEARAKYEAYNTAKSIATKITNETIPAERAYTSATVEAAIAAGNAIAPTSGMAGAIATVTDAAGNAVTELDIMKQEYNAWLVVTGQIGSVDAAADSIDNLGKASVEFGTNLMGQTPKARSFRGEVIRAFEDSARAAQSLSDDIPTQRAIFTGELIKIVAALRASGVKPKDIEAFLGSMDDLPASVADIMRAAAKAVGDTDFKTEVEKAFDKSVKAGTPMTADAMERLAKGASDSAKEKLGLTLEPGLASIIKSGTSALRPTAFNNGKLTGQSIGSGLANGIQASSPIVQAAVARVIEQAKAAADAAAKSQSPSRLFAETGDDMATGVAMGWTRSAPTIYTAITRSVPRAREEASKLARGLAAAFVEAFRTSGGSIASAISEVFGSIPTQSPLEKLLGADAAEKFVKNNKKALVALAELGTALDTLVEKIRIAGEALTSLGELTARPFGRPSELMKMFGSETDIDGVISGYLDLRDMITQAYSVLTDASVVGEKAAKANRQNLNGILKQLEGLTRQMIALREKYEANLKRLEELEKEYVDDVAAINAEYDRLDKEAADNIKAIEDRWAKVIPGLEAAASAAKAVYERENAALQSLISERDGFLKQISDGARSFLNNLNFTKKKIERTVEQVIPKEEIVTTIEDLGNGIRVMTQRTVQPAMEQVAEAIEEPLNAVDIRSSLEQRLADLRAFSQNIQSLIARGLDPSLVRDFVTAGVSGAGTAVAALASGTDDELNAINAAQSALASVVAAFAGYASAQWHDAAIAQQESVVGAALTAQQEADKALAQANMIRQKELDAAKAYQDSLKAAREAALAQRQAQYDAERAQIEAENAALQEQMNALAALIQRWMTSITANVTTETEKAGQESARKLIAGFQKAYPEVYEKLNRLMDRLAASLAREVTITVRTVYQAGNPPGARANGGPVRARNAYIVGERGPELFVPYGNGNIIPNKLMGDVPAMGARAVGGGAAVININVNAGMGADGAEVGRQIVDSLRQYERRNGPIPVRVTG